MQPATFLRIVHLALQTKRLDTLVQSVSVLSAFFSLSVLLSLIFLPHTGHSHYVFSLSVRLCILACLGRGILQPAICLLLVHYCSRLSWHL